MWSKPIRPQAKSFALFPGITISKTLSRHIDNSVCLFLSLFLESLGAIFFFITQTKQGLHEIFWKPQKYSCAEVPEFSISTYPISVAPSFSNLSQPSGQN